MATQARPLAVVTGASSGIGFELAKLCAASALRALGATVDAVEVDLSTQDGCDRLVAAVGGRPVAALLANAGRGLAGRSSIRTGPTSGGCSTRT